MQLMSKQNSASFNPAEFGFDIEPGNNLNGLYACDRDYYRVDKKGRLCIVLSRATAELAKATTGSDVVGVRFNGNGDCLIGDFSPRRKLAKHLQSNLAVISVNGMTDAVENCTGKKFKRLYLQPLPYANGVALLLKATDEIEKF